MHIKSHVVTSVRCVKVATMATKKVARRRSWGTLRVMRNRRIQASYVGENGTRYYAAHTFGAKIDAEGWLADERKLIELGEWTPPDTRASARAAALITLREYSEQWLAHRDLAPKTRALYRDLLKGRILPDLGDTAMRDISSQDVRVWWAELSNKETPTRNTHAYQLLKTMFNTALADRVVSENPCQNKVAGRPPKPRTVESLTPVELQKVAEACPEEYRVAVSVASWCGLRFGELIELRRKDIYVSKKSTVIKVRRQATRVDNKLVVGPPKTGAGVRDVTVPPHVAKLLGEHMSRYTGRGPEAFVFTTTRGQRLSTTAFTKSVKKGFASVGKPGMRVHDLRHVGATMAAQAGATTKELMARIGHSSVNASMRYQIAAQDRDRQIAEALSRMAEA